MKILYACLICIILVAGCATAFNATDNDNKPSVTSPNPVKSNYGSSVSDTRTTEISCAFEIAISDDIWFFGEHSLYFEFLNSSVAYDIYQDDDDNIHIVTTTPVMLTGEDAYRYDQYYSFELMSYNDRITNEILSAKFNGNAGELNQEFDSLPIGSGVIEIKEAHKPVYPEFTAEKQVALNNIREQFFSVMSDPQNVTALYIRDYYDTSDQTVIVYVLGNDVHCYSNASVSGDRVFKPTKIEQEFMYYFDRLVECSFAMDLAPIEPPTNSMAEDTAQTTEDLSDTALEVGEQTEELSAPQFDNAYFEALRAYRDFLLNKRTLGIGELKHNRVYRYIHYVLPTSEFTIIDMNDDGIPELHVKDEGRGYTIITYDQSELSVWAEFSSNTNLLNNRALYTDHWGKGWFCYYELDKDGKWKYYFYWHPDPYLNTDSNEEDMRYFINSNDSDIATGGWLEEITEEEYNEITAPYINYVGDAANYDMIPWINYSEWHEEHIDEYVPIEETEALY